MAEPPRLDAALTAYASHRATLGQACAISGMPLTVFLAHARRCGVLPVYGADEVAAG